MPDAGLSEHMCRHGLGNCTQQQVLWAASRELAKLMHWCRWKASPVTSSATMLVNRSQAMTFSLHAAQDRADDALKPPLCSACGQNTQPAHPGPAEGKLPITQGSTSTRGWLWHARQTGQTSELERQGGCKEQASQPTSHALTLAAACVERVAGKQSEYRFPLPIDAHAWWGGKSRPCPRTAL